MLDRRAFLTAGGLTLASLGASQPLRAQGATVTRRSVRGMTASDPDLAAMSRAVAAMKALPASDPRNWIRFADIHRNFCPHGNWYFLPWHRAYLLSFERIVRQLSGKADFALPYWNWTADRGFPAAFSAGNRESNPLFHPRPGVQGGLRLADDMVGPQVISRIMMSPDFEAFGSARPRGQDSASSQWQRRIGAKTELEFNPHDGVHQSIGGNMSVVDLSARDPIFFLHHANIDRIWDVWERKQKGQNLPSLPDGAPAEPGDKPLPGSDYAQWAGEPFLFFTDAHGAPARKTTCGDYAEIGEFNYDYEPGSGDEVVSMAAAPASPAGVRTFLAEILTSAVNMARPARATVSMPHALLGETSSPSRFFARITVAFKGPMHAVPLRLSVGRDVGPSANAPGFAGMLTMFGHHTMQGPVTFLVPLSAPMRTMQAGRASRAEGLLPLTIAMGDAAGHIEGHSDSEAGAEILAVAVEIH